MPSINPDINALPGILAGLPAGKPVHMLNLLRFRDVALYKEGPAECSGREAYARYSRVAMQALAEVGGHVVYHGTVTGHLIAPPAERWDVMVLVRYPAPQAFATMVALPHYQAATRHRTAALEDSRLVATLAAGESGL